MPLSEQDISDLRYAKRLLEYPSLLARMSNLLGKPLEKGLELLPATVRDMVTGITRQALSAALTVSLKTMDRQGPVPASNFAHKALAGFVGTAGGAFGISALALELPISTMIMLRSIADVARSEGEPIRTPAARLACIEVFALGGGETTDNASETGYFTVRSALAKTVTEAAQYVIEKGLAEEGAPVLVRLIAQIASRFSGAVSQKVAAQAVPIIGAAGGAIVNLAFIDHFQDVARGHFIVRRLERVHGPQIVRAEYERLSIPS